MNKQKGKMKSILLALVLVFSTGSLMAQSKLGHVNSQALLDTMPSRKSALIKLQEFEAAGVQELKEMEADLNKAYAAYQKEQANMSPVIMKIEQEKIMKKEQALQDREQSLNGEMQAYSQELNEPILKLVQNAIKAVADRKKLTYVVDESILLYSAGGENITNEVIVELLKIDVAQ